MCVVLGFAAVSSVRFSLLACLGHMDLHRRVSVPWPELWVGEERRSCCDWEPFPGTGINHGRPRFLIPRRRGLRSLYR